MDRKEVIAEGLKNLCLRDRIQIHNEYCRSVSDYENEVHEMDWIDDYMYGMTPTNIIDAVWNNKDFNWTDEYFVDGIYGITTYSKSEIDGFLDEMNDEIAEAIDDGELSDVSEVREMLDELEFEDS